MGGSEVGSLVATSGELMAPPPSRAPKRKREQVVLDEDEWTDKIEAIIQRDYFPDLEKLESELEWLEAVRTKNPVAIRQAQINIAQRRAGLRTPMGRSPATFATPATGLRTPAMTPDPLATPSTQLADSTEPARNAGATAAPNMSLDRFMAHHTSEDNASFGEILEGINKRRRERYAWVHGQQKGNEMKLLEDKRPLDGYGTSGQPNGALLTLAEGPNNGLYYDPDAVAFTEKELAEQVQGPPKQITARNTRLPGTAPDAADLKHIPRPTRGEGYEPVATPSFTPGPDASPFMTWGELGATPLRLDSDEGAPAPAASTGPQFKVMERKPKDILAHRLADGARLNLQKRAALMSPSLLQNLHGRTPRIRKPAIGTTPQLSAQRVGMSPAAHRLASSMRGNGSAMDKELRASYSRTGVRATRPGTDLLSATPAPSETPAILHGGADPGVPGSSSKPSVMQTPEETSVRDAALKAFEQTLVRREALKAFGKITDNLLDF